MKCPYCNQEIEEGAIYCPFCGEEIPQMKSCPNTACDNYGKELPTNYKFCPKCRTILINHTSGDNSSERKGEEANRDTNYHREKKEVVEECGHKDFKEERKKSDKPRVLFITAEKVKGRFKIGVYSIADNTPIIEDVFEESQVRFESENGNDVLYIESNNSGKWMKISTDGRVQRDLTWEQTSMCNNEPFFDDEKFLKKYPQYDECESIGFLRTEGTHVVIIGNDKEIKVMTDLGRSLFSLGDPNRLEVFPRKMTLSGYIIVENRDGKKGLWNLQGKEVLPCAYNDIKEVNSSLSSDYLELEDDYYRTSLYNVHTKDISSEITSYNKIQVSEEDEIGYIDVVDLATNKVVLKHVCFNSGMSGELADGWYRIHEWKEQDGYMNTLSFILVRGSKYFRMPSKGEILEEVFSHGSTPDERYLISENRIITYMEKDNGGNEFCLDNIKFINIRDYDGNIISTKNNPTIWPLHPYHHGKVLAFKMKDDEVQNLVYIDLQGREHYIANTNHCYIEKPYKIAYEGKCTFVSEDTFIIDYSDDERNFKLMDINGRVLIENAWDLTELTDGYLLYAKDYDKVGVVDAHGYEVLRPIYQGVTILRGNSIKDEFQAFRLFHE